MVSLVCSVHPSAIEDERSRKAFQNVVRLPDDGIDLCFSFCVSWWGRSCVVF